jgi:hypothetical protein
MFIISHRSFLFRLTCPQTLSTEGIMSNVFFTFFLLNVRYFSIFDRRFDEEQLPAVDLLRHLNEPRPHEADLALKGTAAQKEEEGLVWVPQQIDRSSPLDLQLGKILRVAAQTLPGDPSAPKPLPALLKLCT